MFTLENIILIQNDLHIFKQTIVLAQRIKIDLCH